jgi:opacity protein-like surface antigen
MILLPFLVMSSPINLPMKIKNLEGIFWKDGSNIKIGFSPLFDFINERELSDDNADVEGNIFSGKFVVSFNERMDIYTILGYATDLECHVKIGGSDIKYDLEDKFVWGIGFNTIIYEWEDEEICIFLDGNYRNIKDIDYETITVDGTVYSKSQLGSSLDAEWEEWQISLGISKKFGYFTPYLGIKYSDVVASAKVTISGTTYDLDDTDSDKNFGIFIGTLINLTDNLSLNVQGRFIDETAVGVELSFKF